MKISANIAIIFGLFFLSSCTHTPPEITPEEHAMLAAPSQEMKDRIEAILPDALAWQGSVEQDALSNGRPLTSEEMTDARAMGVQHPDRIRIYTVDKIPAFGKSSGSILNMFSMSRAGGLTTGYGVTILHRFEDTRWLKTHEFVHVAQFEDAGNEGMARRYLLEMYTLPGNLIPIEREAIARSEAYLQQTAPDYAY